MKPELVIKKYLKALEIGDYKKMLVLFEKNAMVHSPLYGDIKAEKFYKDLFNKTNKSKILLIDVLKSKNITAGYFIYDWILASNKRTRFACIDLFKFSKNTKIKELTIIYDTAKIRKEFNKLKN